MSNDIRESLDAIITALIRRLSGMNPEILEGYVRTVGPAPYRRLDCKMRALAYIRSRPKKRMVRVDITGLWLVPPRCRLSLPSASGAALAIRSELDVEDAVRYILQTVARTQLSLPNARPRSSSSPNELAAR
jgi:hypothetical protein